MKAFVAALAVVAVLAAGVFACAAGRPPSAKLADEVCVGVFSGRSGVCFPTPS